jgi:hypothetical protein
MLDEFRHAEVAMNRRDPFETDGRQVIGQLLRWVG